MDLTVFFIIPETDGNEAKIYKEATIMKDKLNFDRKKHSMYPKAMGKKIRGKLIADFGETVGNQLWEKTRLKYADQAE